MLSYQLCFEQYYQHLIQVTIKLSAQPQQMLWLPTWIPGSYLLREFARHVESVSAVDTQSNQSICIKKTHKNQWQLQNERSTEVELTYWVYAYDLSVRGAYVDDERLYINPAVVCLAVAGQEDSPVQLQLQLPAALQHFSLATALHTHYDDATYVLSAQDYATLIDSPFEWAEQQQHAFVVAGIPHQVAISGKHQTDMPRLTADLQKICQTEIDIFGEAPFDRYVFMVMATGNSYGGLEHQNSTSLITPRDDLPKETEAAQPSSNYQRFLGLCSHEYFHAWLVKYIRPSNFVQPNLHQETYTSLLWIFEGFTSYYDDLILYRSGVIEQAAYLGLLKEQINRYLQNPGRGVQSVAESSFDAWIKFYRPDENSNNSGTSYYNKGALLALCLDLTLRQLGANLDQVLNALFAQAKQGVQVNENTIAHICEQLTGQSFAGFMADYVYGTKELPLQSLLAEFGVEVKYESKPWALGIKAQENPQGLLVQQVLRHSAAAKSGLSAHDQIIAIQGVKASTAILQQLTVTPTTPTAVVMHVFRRDELKVLNIDHDSLVLQSVHLTVSNVMQLKQWFTWAN